MARPILRIVRIIDPAGVPILTSKIPTQQVQRSVYQLMEENMLCSMATIATEKRAHINTAYFSYTSDLKIYFLSHPGALHCQNILKNPSMALAIFSSSQVWGRPDRGLQLFGICREIPRRETSKADKLYGKRFGEYASWKAGLALGSWGRDYQFYRFITTELKVFDEKKLGAGIFVVARVRGAITR